MADRVALYGWEQSHEIDATGNVWSLDRTYTRPHLGTRTVKGRQLKQRPDRDGYLTVCLNHEGKQLTKWVHVAVAESFIGTRPASQERIECCHLNGDRTDNRVENLAWATSKENSAHMVEHGTRFYAEAHPRARLTPEQVRFVRSYSGNISELARRLGVARSTLTSIRSGANWATIV